MTRKPVVAGTATGPLLADLRELIDATSQQTTVAVNMGLMLLYWRVGQRINTEVLQGERAAYGEQIVSTLSQQLTTDYGRSFGAKNLRHMMRFAEVFPDENIVYALSRHLSWTHFRALVRLIVFRPLNVLQRQLHQAIETARARIEAKGPDEGQGACA